MIGNPLSSAIKASPSHQKGYRWISLPELKRLPPASHRRCRAAATICRGGGGSVIHSAGNAGPFDIARLSVKYTHIELPLHTYIKSDREQLIPQVISDGFCVLLRRVTSSRRLLIVLSSACDRFTRCSARRRRALVRP